MTKIKFRNREVELTRRMALVQSTSIVLSRGVRLEVLCMDGMMTCQVQFVARVSHGMR